MSILLIIGIIILVLWLLGFIFFKSIGAIIHSTCCWSNSINYLVIKSGVQTILADPVPFINLR
jgi:hypothetical protein